MSNPSEHDLLPPIIWGQSFEMLEKIGSGAMG
jgi:hypothetical protein